MRNGRRAVVSCFVSPGTGFAGRDAMIPSAPRPTKKMFGLALNSHFLQSRSRCMLDIVGFV